MAVSVSDKQHRFMMAVAHSPEFAARVGVPQSVGEKFRRGDKAACYPMKDKSKCTGSAERPKDYKRSRRRKKMAGTAFDGLEEIYKYEAEEEASFGVGSEEPARKEDAGSPEGRQTSRTSIAAALSKILKYSPSQPRWPAGSGGKSGEWKPTTGGMLKSRLMKDGGFTYQPVLTNSPTTGYALSIDRTNEVVLEGRVTAKQIEQYIDERKAVFEKDSKAHVGGWIDPDSGKVYLDVSIIEPDRDTAVALAQEHGQEGIYDLSKGETIIVKPEEQRRKEEAGEVRLSARCDSGADCRSHQPHEGQGYRQVLKYSPSQPRWEAGTSGSKGGQFRPKSGSPLSQAMANMGVLSRTFQGVVDTSASKDKAQFMTAEALSGDPKAIAIRNFQQAFESAYQNRDVKLSSPEEVTRFIDDIATTMSKDLTTVLYREHDSDKFNYSKVSDIQRDMQAYSKELLQRLGGDDPVGTAAWARHRLNEIHPYADGVGKVVEVVADWVLMRSGMPLPKLSDKTRDEYFSAVNSGVEGFTQFYRERMPSRKQESGMLSKVFKFNPYHDPKNGRFTTADMASHTRARQEELRGKGGSHKWFPFLHRVMTHSKRMNQTFLQQDDSFVKDKDSEGWHYGDPTAAVAESLVRDLHGYDSGELNSLGKPAMAEQPGPFLKRRRDPGQKRLSETELGSYYERAASTQHPQDVLQGIRRLLSNTVPMIGRSLGAEYLGPHAREGDYYINGLLESGSETGSRNFSGMMSGALQQMGFRRDFNAKRPDAFEKTIHAHYNTYTHPESGMTATVISGMAKRSGNWEGEFIIDLRNPKGAKVKKFEQVLKFNPYHDPKTGRFTDKATGGGGASYGQSTSDYVKNYGRQTRNSWRNPGLEAMASRNSVRNPGLEAFAAKRRGRGKDQVDATYPDPAPSMDDLRRVGMPLTDTDYKTLRESLDRAQSFSDLNMDMLNRGQIGTWSQKQRMAHLWGWWEDQKKNPMSTDEVQQEVYRQEAIAAALGVHRPSMYDF